MRVARLRPLAEADFVRPDHADVVRLLADALDLPVTLADLELDRPATEPAARP